MHREAAVTPTHEIGREFYVEGLAGGAYSMPAGSRNLLNEVRTGGDVEA